VRELVRGDLWVRLELESAWSARGELDRLLVGHEAMEGMPEVARHVASVDGLYREWTVVAPPIEGDALVGRPRTAAARAADVSRSLSSWWPGVDR
jgi:hypothetical protein